MARFAFSSTSDFGGAAAVAGACAVGLLVLGACDVFAPRVPCAVDDECGATEACVAGFCADAGEGEGEGREGEGEGESEPPLESHPLRGTVCSDVGVPSVSDGDLICSVFGVFEEPCAGNGDCGDPAARFCTDPGPGPAICANSPDLRRSICPDNTQETSGESDLEVDFGTGCFDGDVVIVPIRNCSSSTGFSVDAIGGDLRVRMNHTSEDPEVPCTSLTFLSLGTLPFIGGDYIIAPDDTLTDRSATQAPLGAVRLFDTVAVFGDFVINNTRAVVSTAAFEIITIGGDARFTTNDLLDSVDFTNLRSIGGSLIIEDAPALDFVRISPLVSVGGDVIIRNAPLLARCSIEAMLTNTTVGGTTIIEGVDDTAVCP